MLPEPVAMKAAVLWHIYNSYCKCPKKSKKMCDEKWMNMTFGYFWHFFILILLPSGYVKIAIENDHL